MNTQEETENMIALRSFRVKMKTFIKERGLVEYDLFTTGLKGLKNPRLRYNISKKDALTEISKIRTQFEQFLETGLPYSEFKLSVDYGQETHV